MYPYLQLIRPVNCLMAAIAVGIATVIAADGIILNMWQNVLFAIVTVILFTSAGNALNDYNDRKIDKLNKPHRPIPAGKLKPKNALHFAYLCFLLSLLTGLLIDTEWMSFKTVPVPFIIVLVCFAVMIGYETKFKRKGFSGNLCISFLTGTLFVFGGAAVGNIAVVFTFAVLAFFATLGREIVKDIEDMKGDKSYRTTLPMTIGVKNSAIVCCFAFLLAVLFSGMPYLMKLVNVNYLIVVAIANAIFIYCAFISFSKPSGSAKMAKVGMFVALVAFVLGRLV